MVTPNVNHFSISWDGKSLINARTGLRTVSLRDRINIYRRYPYWAAKGCIFIHIPKAAGTSINYAIYGRTLGHFRAEDIRSRFPSLFEKSFVFSVVRNPWDRALSAYRFAKRGRTVSMGMKNPEQYRTREFYSFERFLLDWLSQQDLEQVDRVFSPQYKFLVDESGEQIVPNLIKLERIRRDWSMVEAGLGRKVVLDHLNRTSEEDGYRSAYRNDRMKEIVQRLYQEDITRFGYSF